MRWYRQLVANKYDGSSKRGPGRPPKPDELRNLILTVARDNPSWGYTRLRDVMRSLGHEVGRTTIQHLLKEHGIEPAPRRQRQLSWREFLRAHWGAIAARDALRLQVPWAAALAEYFRLSRAMRAFFLIQTLWAGLRTFFLQKAAAPIVHLYSVPRLFLRQCG